MLVERVLRQVEYMDLVRAYLEIGENEPRVKALDEKIKGVVMHRELGFTVDEVFIPDCTPYEARHKSMKDGFTSIKYKVPLDEHSAYDDPAEITGVNTINVTPTIGAEDEEAEDEPRGAE